MLTLRALHHPEYFGFSIEDDVSPKVWGAQGGYDDVNMGFSTIENGISVRVLSEYSKIPIDVEYDTNEIALSDAPQWDHIVECSFFIRGDRILLTTATDTKPILGFAAKKGRCRVRIYWGGQHTGKDDGSSEDFYLIQIWPSNDASTKVVKGEEHWPRPEQPWERELRLERAEKSGQV